MHRLKAVLATRIGLRFVDLLLAPAVLLGGIAMRAFRRSGTYRMNLSRATLSRLGVHPLINHYYDPYPLKRTNPGRERRIDGIDFRIGKQLDLLEAISMTNTVAELNWDAPTPRPESFHISNTFFESGDAEVAYQLVRYFQPSVIVEVGAGHSTKVIAQAISDEQELSGFTTRHIVYEPFENSWLDELDVELARRDVRDYVPQIVANLKSGSGLLFIDSSHVVARDSDVLTLFSSVVPEVSLGTIIHFHDIFSPYDYPEHWLDLHRRLWTEQYLLEAFMSFNQDYEVLLSLHLLSKEHREQLQKAAPYLKSDSSPSSFYIRRR